MNEGLNDIYIMDIMNDGLLDISCCGGNAKNVDVLVMSSSGVMICMMVCLTSAPRAFS